MVAELSKELEDLLGDQLWSISSQRIDLFEVFLFEVSHLEDNWSGDVSIDCDPGGERFQGYVDHWKTMFCPPYTLEIKKIDQSHFCSNCHTRNTVVLKYHSTLLRLRTFFTVL